MCVLFALTSDDGFEVILSRVLLPSVAGFFASEDDPDALCWIRADGSSTFLLTSSTRETVFLSTAAAFLFSRKLPSQIAVCASRKMSRYTKNFIFWIFERVIVPCHLNDGDDDDLSLFKTWRHDAPTRSPCRPPPGVHNWTRSLCHASSRITPAVSARGGLRWQFRVIVARRPALARVTRYCASRHRTGDDTRLVFSSPIMICKLI